MNERIKKLLNVCGMPNEDLMEIYSDTNKTFYMEQFAEMIVKECAEFARQHNLEHAERSHLIHKAIKEHFGVK